MLMTAAKIVTHYTDGRMLNRPEYYSGRGATLSDLNSGLLEKIHQGVLAEHGKDAAEGFVDMVENIDVLSATLFLNSLYELEACRWKWHQKKGSKASEHIDVGPDDGTDRRNIQGQISILAWTTGGSTRDDTFMIKSEFLAAHGREPQMPKGIQEWTNDGRRAAFRDRKS